MASGRPNGCNAGDVTASELVEASITRIEKQNPSLNAVIHPLFDKARRQVASREIGDGPFARRALRREGRRLPYGRRPLSHGHAGLEGCRPCGRERHRAGAPVSSGGLRLRGQDEHARAGLLDHHRAAGLRPDTQSLRPRSFDGRLERRLGGCGGGALGLCRPRQRHGRIDPGARQPLRPGGAEAQPWTHDAGAASRRVLGAAHPRTRAHPLGARLGGHPRCDPRPCAGRSVHRAPAERPVARRRDA